MKTIKIYFALYRDKVRDKVVNSDGIFMRTKEYISVPSKKNSQTPLVSKSTGKSFIKKSDQFINWYKIAYPTMLNEKQRIQASGISLPIYRAKMTVIFYFPNEMARDLSNKVESLNDLLVDVGILYDDRFQVCNDLHIKGYICKNQPRTEIYIHTLDGEDEDYEIDRTDYEKFNASKKQKVKDAKEWKVK